MKKAILIGNGFSGQIIDEFNNSNIRTKFFEMMPTEYHEINEYFSKFRFSMDEDVFNFKGGSYPPESLDPSDNLHITKPYICYNKKLTDHIKRTLSELDLKEKYFDEYFIQYGLIFECVRDEILGFENLMKVCKLFNLKYYDKVQSISKQIIFNGGNCGLESTKGLNTESAKLFFDSFSAIYTTNYDLILDKLCLGKKIKHLHGSYNMRMVNDGGPIYIKVTDYLLKPEDALIIWGINGDEKIAQMETGLTFPFSRLEFPMSLLKEYMNEIEQIDVDEMHIFGYSGENDTHLNSKIIANKAFKKIICYINPDYLANDNQKERMKNIFKDNRIVFKSWEDIWGNIK